MMEKRIFTALMALMAIVMTAGAQSKETYAWLDNGTLKFYYDDQRSTRQGTTFDIPWVEQGYSDLPGWSGNESVVRVEFHSLGEYSESFWAPMMFYNMPNLEYIGNNGQYGLATLSGINFTNMSGMFWKCPNLKGVNGFKYLNTTNVKDMSEMFDGCESLEEIDLSNLPANFNTSKVEDMYYMFSDCKALTTLDLSGFNTVKLETTYDMFNNCINLETIFCGNDWNAPGNNIRNSNNMFAGCTKLKGGVDWASGYTNDINYANPTTGYFTKAIVINEKNFPDEKFRNYLLNLSYGQDGMLTEAELTSVTKMSLSNKQIADLTGIEYFTQLTDLSCRGNRLTSLDLSQNTMINRLDCAENQLTSLVMGRCAPMDFFNCSGNKLAGEYMDAFLRNLPTILNGSKPSIYIYNETIYSEQNALTQNQIAVLLQRGWQPIFTFKTNNGYWADAIIENAVDVPLTMYNFPDANFRAWLSSEGYAENYLLKADKASTTYTLDVSNQEIADLTGIGFFIHLDELYCYNNQISGETMDALVQNLPTVDKGRLVVIDDEGTNEYNTMTKEQANAASMKGWTPLTTSDECLADYIPINEIHFPDENFRNCLLAERYGEDYILTVGEIANITSLNVGWKNIANLTGLQNFTALQTLNCAFNQLTWLDLTGLNNLQTVYCDGNKIHAVASMSSLVNSLCDRRGFDYGQLYVIYNTNEQNAITTEQILMANAKNWKVYIFANEQWKECTTYVYIEPYTFPDENFRNWLRAQDYGQDGLLTNEEIVGVKSMDVRSQNIADLTGIEYFTALQLLQCQDNQLTTLDVTTNIRLWHLDCTDNQLETLHLTSVIPLQRLYCSGNKLGIEAMTDILENLRDWSFDTEGRLNVISNTEEHNVINDKLVRRANDKNWKVYKQLEDGRWIEYPIYDIAYAMNIVDYLLGNPTPETFNAAAADANEDGRVSIADVSAIINQLLLEAAKDQLQSNINKSRDVLANCRADLESKDSAHEHTDLWSKLEQLETAVDNLATAVEKATTRDEIDSFTTELMSIVLDVEQLRTNIMVAFH